MKYAVIKCVNGTFNIVSEWDTNKEKAIVDFHNVCTTLWNADDVRQATVEVVDEKFNILKIEYIEKEE